MFNLEGSSTSWPPRVTSRRRAPERTSLAGIGSGRWGLHQVTIFASGGTVGAHRRIESQSAGHHRPTAVTSAMATPVSFPSHGPLK